MDPFFSRKRPADEIVSSGDESDGGARGMRSDDEQDSSASETMNEKRVRLARELIAAVRPEDDDEDEENDGNDRVHERLHEAARNVQGAVMLAGRALQSRSEPLGSLLSVGVCLTRFPAAVTAMSLFSLDGEACVVAGSKGGHLQVVRLRDGRRVWAHEGDGKKDVTAVCVSGDNVFVGRRRLGQVEVWSLAHVPAKLDSPARRLQGHGSAVTALASDGQGTVYSCGGDCTVREWDAESGLQLGVHYGHQQPVTALVSQGGGGRLVTVSSDRTLHVWKLREEVQLVFRGPQAPLDCVVPLALSGPLSRGYATGGQDGAVLLWSTARKKPVCSLPAAHGGRWISALAALPRGDLLVSGSSDGFVRLWRVLGSPDSPSLVSVALLPAPGFVNALALSARRLDGQLSLSILVALGTEHRLGRWWSTRKDSNILGDDVCRDADNALYSYTLILPDLSGDDRHQDSSSSSISEEADGSDE